MKIAKYGEGRVAAVEGDWVVDLDLAHRYRLARLGADVRDGGHVPADLQAFIAAGEPALRRSRAAVEFWKERARERPQLDGRPVAVSLRDTRLLAPLPSLGSKLICMGRNFASHADAVLKQRKSGEANDSAQPRAPESSWRPKRPAGFIKFADTVVGPGDEVTYPSRTRKLDYEVEIAAIIGTRGKDIGEPDAMRHVFGYTVFCDYSARDQTSDMEDMNWVRHHKNFDCAAAMGPWIVTADEIPDPHAVQLRTWVNGELRQDGSTREMIFRFPRIIEYYSVDQTLHPGDLFASGTCLGTGIEKPNGSWLLRPGDRIEFEIPEIGRFANTIVAKR